MAAERRSLSRALRAHPFPMIGSFLLVGAATANVLDAATTWIGLNEGFREASPSVIAIMQRYGLAGFTVEKLGIALVFMLVYLYQKTRWERSNVVYILVILVLAAVALVIFGLPVASNVNLIVRGYGL